MICEPGLFMVIIIIIINKKSLSNLSYAYVLACFGLVEIVSSSFDFLQFYNYLHRPFYFDWWENMKNLSNFDLF